MTLYLPAPSERKFSPSPSPWSAIRTQALTGTALVLIFVVGFGFWAAKAPLMSAAQASGIVVVESARKTVQHFEGGMIAAILVSNGAVVEQGQPLVQLDDTKARTTLAALEGQLWDALAGESRVIAERDGTASVLFPSELTARATEPSIDRILRGQAQLFEARRSAVNSKIDLIRQRKKETQEEILGLRNQIDIAKRQMGYGTEELEAVRQLADKGLVPKFRLLTLQTSVAETEAKKANSQALLARAEQSVIESEISLLNLTNETQKDVADELRTTQKQIHELREKIQNASDVMQRTVVRAPEAGVVTDLRVHTLGGVINPGDPLMDLVPQRDRMVIDAQVRPDDIHLVQPGLRAEVRLLPYKQRQTGPLAGEVIYVSADRLIDKASNRPYFGAKVAISDGELAKAGVEMRPGMPSDVMIQTGETTVALYALAPLIDSFRHAFREK